MQILDSTIEKKNVIPQTMWCLLCLVVDSPAYLFSSCGLLSVVSQMMADLNLTDFYIWESCKEGI
jgi:hypothetical protein